jgi:hypothetical protein
LHEYFLILQLLGLDSPYRCALRHYFSVRAGGWKFLYDVSAIDSLAGDRHRRKVEGRAEIGQREFGTRNIWVEAREPS